MVLPLRCKIFFAILFILTLIPSLSAQTSQSTYSEPLIQKAIDQKLYNDPYWRTLLHYLPPKRAGRLSEMFVMLPYISEVDNTEFFLADNGKISPENELIVSINEFFIKKNKALINRFPGRFKWLHEKLDITDMPYEDYFEGDYRKTWDKRGEFDKVVFVFASEHIKQPQSAFGHSLVVVKYKGTSPDIGLAVNYAADSRGANYFDFITKGIAGGFYGEYEVVSYYRKLQYYNYIESRDIWEYTLNLTQEEIERLVDHLWELVTAKSKYYFFTENCSYNVLHLLDAARPGLDLVETFGPWVVPSDTLKAVSKAGLIEKSRFRPSIGSRLYRIAEEMDGRQVEIARLVAQGKIDPEAVLTMDEFSEEEKIEILDFAVELYQSEHFPKFGSDKLDDFNKEVVRLSRPRSTLGFKRYSALIKEDPRFTHNPFKVEGGYGHEFDNSFIYTTVRPSYHGFMDSSYGFHFGNSMTIAETTFRYYTDGKQADPSPSKALTFDNITLLELTSFKSWNSHFHDLSWRGKAGVGRNMPEDYNLGFYTELETGVCFELFPRMYYYLLPGSYSIYKRDINFSVQCDTGFLIDGGKTFKARIKGNTRKYLLGDALWVNRGGVEGEYFFMLNGGLSLEYEKVFTDYRSYDNYKGSFKFYF